jgi:hypothetical protein
MNLLLKLSAASFCIVSFCAMSSCSATFSSGAASAFWGGFSSEIGEISKAVRPGEAAAVSFIYDSENGNVTALGNLYRDKTEMALSDDGVTVKPRRDLALIIEDVESHGFGKTEQDVWDASGADVVICGRYSASKADKPGEPDAIYLLIKAFRVSDGSLVKAVEYKDKAPSGWARMHVVKHGNVWHREMKQVVGKGADYRAPKLSAELNKKPACYLPGEPASIAVKTEPGVHLYIVNLAADLTAALLYPNAKLNDNKLASGNFVFPPPALGDRMRLVFFPLGETTTFEDIKVIASRTPMDLSFLPVAENEMFYGAKGGDIKKMVDFLKEAEDWSQVSLSYAVGPDCAE